MFAQDSKTFKQEILSSQCTVQTCSRCLLAYRLSCSSVFNTVTVTCYFFSSIDLYYLTSIVLILKIDRQIVMTKTKFYAVKAGYKPGIYTSWKSAFDQVNGFNSAEFKSVNTRKEAEKFISKCDDEDPTRKADYVYSCDSQRKRR